MSDAMREYRGDSEAGFVITKVSTVGIGVRDQDAALAFYTDKLGFEVRKKVDIPGFKWFEVAPNGGETTLVLTGEEGYPSFDPSRVGKYTQVAFDTDDIHEVYRTYTERGVRFLNEPRHEEPGYWFASFVDQDDNEFYLFQQDQ